MDTDALLAIAPWLGGVAGAAAAYLLLANRRIKGYQSPLRWLPALVAGGKVRDLALVAVVTIVGAALGSSFVVGILLALEART